MEVMAILWIALCALVGWLAHTRGRNAAGFAIGAFLFSPILAFLLVIAIPPEPRK